MPGELDLEAAAPVGSSVSPEPGPLIGMYYLMWFTGGASSTESMGSDSFVR